VVETDYGFTLKGCQGAICNIGKVTGGEITYIDLDIFLQGVLTSDYPQKGKNQRPPNELVDNGYHESEWLVGRNRIFQMLAMFLSRENSLQRKQIIARTEREIQLIGLI